LPWCSPPALGQHQPGAFKGAVRVADGEVEGLEPKCGYAFAHFGKPVREMIFIWSPSIPAMAAEPMGHQGSSSLNLADPG
jgi:hypothetical protein